MRLLVVLLLLSIAAVNANAKMMRGGKSLANQFIWWEMHIFYSRMEESSQS